MRRTYVIKCGYEITKCRDASPDLHDPMLMKEAKAMYHGPLRTAIQKLSSDHMFGGEDIKGKEYKAFLSKCLINGAVDAKIVYCSGYARCSFTFDHELSEQELSDLDDAVEAQMTDGYGENPFELCTIGMDNYWLTI